MEFVLSSFSCFNTEIAYTSLSVVAKLSVYTRLGEQCEFSYLSDLYAKDLSRDAYH